jgi:hypothetical protein
LLPDRLQGPPTSIWRLNPTLLPRHKQATSTTSRTAAGCGAANSHIAIRARRLLPRMPSFLRWIIHCRRNHHSLHGKRPRRFLSDHDQSSIVPHSLHLAFVQEQLPILRGWSFIVSNTDQARRRDGICGHQWRTYPDHRGAYHSFLTPADRRAPGARRHLLRRARRGRRRTHRRGQLPGIDLRPGALVVADEIPAARPAEHLDVLDAGRQHTAVA